MKVLFFALGGIGDFIMFTPVVKKIISECEPELISFVVENSACAQIASFFPRTKKVCIYETLWKTVKSLKRTHFDVSVGVGARAALVPYLLGVRKRAGLKYRAPFIKSTALKGSWSLFLTDVCGENDRSNHNVLENIKLLQVLDIIITHSDVKLWLPIPKKAFTKIDVFWHEVGVRENGKLCIAIHPGTNRSQVFKRWPLRYFSKLCDLLVAEFDAFVFIFEGPDECGLGEQVIAMSKSRSSMFLIKDFSIHEVAALISSCNFMVSSDSGLSHIAAAVGTPPFTIYGPVSEKRSSPWGYDDLVIRKRDLACRPCYTRPGQKIDCDKKLCLEQILPEEVLDFVKAKKGVRWCR